MVFDIPADVGTYEVRYHTLGTSYIFYFLLKATYFLTISLFVLVIFAILEERFAQSPCKYIEVAPREVCTGMTHLEKVFQDIMDGGGEGIIIRNPSSPYEPGRSKGFLKHKVKMQASFLGFFISFLSLVSFFFLSLVASFRYSFVSFLLKLV